MARVASSLCCCTCTMQVAGCVVCRPAPCLACCDTQLQTRQVLRLELSQPAGAG
jgi:hypothetical protein